MKFRLFLFCLNFQNEVVILIYDTAKGKQSSSQVKNHTATATLCLPCLAPR